MDQTDFKLGEQNVQLDKYLVIVDPKDAPVGNDQKLLIPEVFS